VTKRLWAAVSALVVLASFPQSAPAQSSSSEEARRLNDASISYSRARGAFAGVTINGSTIRQDRDGNQRFCGKPLDSEPIVFGSQAGTPEPVGVWLQALNRYAK
jgi:lipid-binding SYLF domain-containing protein